MITKKVEIFTDGACRGNPGPGGWGALLRYDDQEKKLLGSESMTTNNRMELMAVIKALHTLKRACNIAITTDSQYVKNGVNQWLPRWKENGWRTSNRQPVKNQDLWKDLDRELIKHPHVEWHWVKGHTGHPENTMADQLANQAIDNMYSNS